MNLPQCDTDAVLVGRATTSDQPAALLPGAFNPIHAGHWGLADIAAELLDSQVAFELSLHNVDKPPLTAAEVERRLQPFAGRADVWLTCAATFVQKARLFPGAVFVVGADTAARIVAPRYYQDSADRLDQALGTIADLGCRFLVAARVDATGRLLVVDEVDIPSAWRGLFRAIDPQLFRLDISSTALRARS
jgi:nicotinic acid mononucleotide adenylyltransferase